MTDTIAPLGPQDFDAHVGTRFSLAVSGSTVELELRRVHRFPERQGSPRPDPFALEFAAPGRETFGQGTYEIDHPELGALSLFVVPGPPHDDGATGYDVTFN